MIMTQSRLTSYFFALLVLTIAVDSVPRASAFLDYTEEYLLDCREPHTNEILQETLIIHEIDKWVFICLAPFAILSTLFIIITFIKYPTTRKQPGDIILAISVSDLILSLHWIISSGYMVKNGTGPDPSGGFCQTNAFFSSAAGTTEFLYNCCFCIYVIFVIRNNLKGQNIQQKFFHMVCIGCTVLVIVLLFTTGNAGLNLFGTCSFKVNDGFPLFGVVILFLYLFISWYTIWYFRKSVPNNQIFKKMREEFLRYYFYYVVWTSMIWTILAATNLFAGLNCSDFHNPSLNVLITIGNVAKIGTPVVLSIIRYKDPTIKKKVGDQLTRWGLLKSSNKRISLTSPLNQQNSQNFEGQNIPLSEQSRRIFEAIFAGRQQSNQIDDERRTSSDGGNWLARLTQNLRMTQIYTMISGVVINDIQMKKAEANQTVDANQSINNQHQNHHQIIAVNSMVGLNDDDFSETNEIELNDDLVADYIPFHKTQPNMPQIHGRMTVHAPRVFRALQVSDGHMANVESSFGIEENITSIQKMFGGPDGGKSGEFFYFSRDRKMMIKTMASGELEAFMKNLKKYIEHLVLNEDSLIVKIYGVYSFTINKQSNSILIMRNITQCPGEYIERTFDLKGSTYDREVSNSKKNKGKSLKDMTLKDIDFQKTEGKLWIERRMSKRCSDALEKDARFFEQCGLIDYSLIVFKINWVKYSIHTGIEVADARNNFHTSMNSIESTKEIGLYYHIGIIDYLQEWNVQKNVEKAAKKLIQLNNNLDTSSQNQKIYADRFVNEIAKGIFEL